MKHAYLMLMLSGSLASAQAPPAVLVARPRAADVIGPDIAGRVEPAETIAVRARVDGTVAKAHVQPGAVVQKGDLLFEIELGGVKADLKLAEETVRLLEDWLAQLEEVHRRAAKDPKKAKEDVVVLAAQRDVAAARLLLARLTVAERRADLDRGRIVAPADGKIVDVAVQAGDRVDVGAATATVLCTIARTDSVRVGFEVEEACFLRLRQLVREGKIQKFSDVEVLVGLEKDDRLAHRGWLELVDVRVDPKTARALILAVCPDPGGKLAAEKQPVRVRLVTSRALLVPDPAVLTDPKEGKYLLIVNAKNVVEARPVKTGGSRAGWRTVESGLEPGDWVVVGSERLQPGADAKLSAADFARDLLLLRVRPGSTVEPLRIELPPSP